MFASNSDSRGSLEAEPDPDASMAVGADSTCIANIGPRERRQRLIFGLCATGVGVILAFALVVVHADSAWRLLLFVPFSAGASGYFQARDKT